MERTDDGFLLSEEDLRLRGPGDFFGMRQSGDLKFQKASIVTDANILEIAKNDALDILMNKDAYHMEEYSLIFNYLKEVLKKANLD
jgi:ATP-dependent DNA helicase RecG